MAPSPPIDSVAASRLRRQVTSGLTIAQDRAQQAENAIVPFQYVEDASKLRMRSPHVTMTDSDERPREQGASKPKRWKAVHPRHADRCRLAASHAPAACTVEQFFGSSSLPRARDLTRTFLLPFLQMQAVALSRAFLRAQHRQCATASFQ